MQHPCAIQQSLDNIFAASKVRLFLWHKFTASLQELDWQQSSLVEYQATDIYIYMMFSLHTYTLQQTQSPVQNAALSKKTFFASPGHAYKELGQVNGTKNVPQQSLIVLIILDVFADLIWGQLFVFDNTRPGHGQLKHSVCVSQRLRFLARTASNSDRSRSQFRFSLRNAFAQHRISSST